MPVTIKSTGGGSVTMTAASTASDYTLTLPATSGTVLQSGTAVTAAQGGTGQTSLTANNVILGNGTSAVQFVAPGSSGNVLTSDGTTWASSAPTSTGVNVQTFTSSGTWTKPSVSANSRVLIQAWGGGASGGKGSSSSGGGGGGGYIERWLTLSAMASTETVTIGAGGTAISAANTPGNQGGNTTVGSLITAYGGGGGGGYSPTGNNVGGGGGGQLSAGVSGTGSTATVGNPGKPYIGWTSDVSNVFFAQGQGQGGAALANNGGIDAFWHGGGGGGDPAPGITTIAGFNSVWGGGGGGRGVTSGAGGTSLFGGNGGAGSATGTATSGTQPGGAGGGTSTGASSGAGAAGQVIITVFPA